MAIGWAASHISRLSRHAEMGWLNVGGYTKDVPKPTEIELLKHVACLCAVPLIPCRAELQQTKHRSLICSLIRKLPKLMPPFQMSPTS